MNDLVQNKIVEQKDILKIIEILNNFHREKMEMFNKTQSEIDAEEEEYNKWRDARYSSNNFDNYPDFQSKKHTNKLVYEKFAFSFYCVDGLSYEDKTYSEAQIIMNSGYSSFERITVSLDMTWNKTYQRDDYNYSDKNNANISVSVTFREDDVYTYYSTKSADADIKFLKSEINDVFNSLKPKYSSIIARRESIKYQSTLSISYIISAAIVVIVTIFLKNSEIKFFSYWQFLAFILLALIINMFIQPQKLNSLYKQIIPKKKTVYEGKELKKVDNIKEFKSTAEVHIGSNSYKAGKRDQIVEIQKKSLSSNFFALIFCIIVIFVVCMF